MLVTAKEAKEKWCPETRWNVVVDEGQGGDGLNRAFVSLSYKKEKSNNFNNLDFARCVALECMMWRWVSDNPDSDYGYCGLAGGVIK